MLQGMENATPGNGIVVGYDVDLLPVGDGLEFRLELPEMKVPCVADVNVASPSGTEIKLDGEELMIMAEDDILAVVE